MRQFIYLMSSHTDQQHRTAVRLADMVRTSEPRTLAYRGENPGCKILKYVNVAHSINNIGETVARVNGWICRDDHGGEAHHTDTPTEYALDLSIEECRQAVAQHCRDQIDAGYDGIYGDYLGKPFSYNKYHYTDGLNHADGTLYTDAEMAENMSDLIDRMRTLDCGTLVGNGVPQATGSYGYYHANYKALSDPVTVKLDYVMIEGALGWDEAEALTRTEADWSQTVQMWRELPAKLILYCKPIGSSIERMRYALGSYMLADRTDVLIHYGSVGTYQLGDDWQRLMGYDYGDYVDKGENWYETDNAVFTVNPDDKTGSIKFKGGEPLSFTYKNEGPADLTVYKRRIVVTDTLVIIPAGETVEITLDLDEALVQK